MASNPPGGSGPFSRHTSRELCGHRKKITSLAWSPNGKRLATGSSDTGIRLWAVEPFQVAKAERAEIELKGHSDYVTALQWKPSPSTSNNDVLASIASSDKDKSVRFWDVRTGKCTNMLNMPASGSVSLAWNADGTSLAVANNKEDTITFVDTRKNKVLKSVRLSTNPYQMYWGPLSSAPSPSGASGPHPLCVATNDGTINLYSVPDVSLMWSLKGHMHSCYTFAVDKDNEIMASGGGDAIVSIWETVNMTCVRTITRMDGPVKDLSLSRDGKYLAYASESIPVDLNSPHSSRGVVDIVSIKTGELLMSFASRAAIDNVQWHPECPVLAFNDEREESDGRGNRTSIGIVSFFAPPKGG